MKPEKFQLRGQRNVGCVHFGRIPFRGFLKGNLRASSGIVAGECALFSPVANQEMRAGSNNGCLQHIKESVSWLNQGADETIANTVERLNDLQRKIADKQAQLEETQKRVTETKEELFNLTEQNREVNRELLAITDKFESEQKRLDSIKKERMDEEAMLVRKKIENDNKPASTPLSAPKSKKSQVTIESFPDDFLLGEEEDLLSED